MGITHTACAALVAAGLSTTTSAHADNLAQQYLRGSTSITFGFSLRGAASSFDDRGSAFTDTGVIASAQLRRTWRGFYAEVGAHGSLGFGASGLGGQSRSAGYGGSLGAGYGVALGDRTALALGLSLNASTALGAYSNGSEIRTYLNDVVSVGLIVPVTVMISQGVYIEPYLTAHFAASLNPEVANSTSIGFGVGHRIGFVL